MKLRGDAPDLWSHTRALIWALGLFIVLAGPRVRAADPADPADAAADAPVSAYRELVRQLDQETGQVGQLLEAELHAETDEDRERLADDVRTLEASIAKKYTPQLEDLAERHGDVRVGNRTLASLVDSHVFELNHLRVGMPAPDVSGTDSSGRMLSLSDASGAVVMLDFWGHWSGHCRSSYPMKKALVDEYSADVFTIIGVNNDDSVERLQQIEEREEIPWRSLFDGANHGPIATRWNVWTWPAAFFIDAGGVIRYKGLLTDASGMLRTEEERERNVRAAIERLVSER